MRTEWLLHSARRRVVVFFNGWGMDHGIARHLLANTPEGFGYDLLSCYDYGDPRLAPDTLTELGQYDERIVVAWSLGVWAAALSGIEGVSRSLAINGTLTPLDRKQGIRPDIFQATLDGWSEKGRERFNRRICGSNESLELLQQMGVQRDIADQKRELEAIFSTLSHSTSATGYASWGFSRAVVGDRDMIFTPAAQEAAWQGVPVSVVSGMPHMPFAVMKGWQEVLVWL
ncbi:DUF452 family protein [Prosthecochloris sp. CIB 2401]|uniref:DUF452 family protein n=1 Tax=Prosthecochloris sp. CIB 2401 TaxID=1868325 RepID=UPI00080A9E78|nr:alpha/beta fold hydrolase [Prosthecochloris sp. CIB 2401]ANT65938.1 hypothetical protein Ptc2401_02211 [Prosthecochloris sp. CIB 2401]